MVAPNYCSSISLQFAKNRIKNPPYTINSIGSYTPIPYEHHVGSWALTMLKTVFNEPEWIITPEKKDDHSKKRPDLVVEKVSPQGTESHVYLIMELKSKSGDRFEDALAQVLDEIAETMQHTIEAYIVIQRGTKIGFFEYHNDVSNLDEEQIPHFRGCVSLTQTYTIDGNNTMVLNDVPNDLDLLYHNYQRLRKQTSLRHEAAQYDERCVFDLDIHEREINFLFHHMVNKPPRSSIWDWMLFCVVHLVIWYLLIKGLMYLEN